jgi:hypothetical protein
MNSRPVLFTLSVGTFLTAAFAGVQQPTKPLSAKPKRSTVEFNRDVRPLLAQHCWPCHGQDKEALAKTGGLRLDTFAGATADRGGIHAIVPGSPSKSAMIDRITAADKAMQMPPADSGIKALTPAEAETIKTWIAEGAEYRAHWAFLPPKMPALPAVRDSKWVKNEIDRFVLGHLEESGLSPEREADKRTLIRRVSLTLTGLPPTPEEVNRFLADRDPMAYDRLVDRLLASPRYGENQARYWLDAVRYADTHGLHIDNERSIFPYRDWVVRAYNEDLPYDKFATWQIAGDLLPNPTLDERIATGYVRLNPTTAEGGAIEAEFLAKNTFDRVDTTSTVFLGVTLQCARCHDHKYDPFSQKDYYSMYAYFDSTTDTPLDGNQRYHPPVMKAPLPEQARQLERLRQEIVEATEKASLADAKSWALQATSPVPMVSAWQISGPYPEKSFDAAYDVAFAPEKADTKATWRPIDFKLDTLTPNLIGKENAAIYLRAKVTAERAENIELRLGTDDAVRVWLNHKSVFDNKASRGLTANSDTVKVSLEAGENDLLIKVVNGAGEDGAFVGIGGADAKRIGRAQEFAKRDNLDAKESAELLQTYLTLGPSNPDAERYRKAEAAYKAQDDAIPMTYVAEEMPKPRPTFLLRRGEYSLPGPEVQRAIPAVFGSIPAGVVNNRLGLAKWIVSPNNPLTARVIVNRIWQQHFGTGLVKSSEDFGSRGDWPSNPELLDYLACRFVKDGWSVKKLTRLIVTSAAYRQSAAVSLAKRAKDPENTLISRGPRFRLDAEVIRDSALYAAGLLKEKPGGHADKPYQPPGLWEIIAYPISDTAKYMQDHGDALYRRSLYMFWKRTSPPPTMLLFDAPMRESCVVRRSRTNTPTQALATLNETGFFEDARAMAQRVLHAKPTDAARLDYAFRLATGRPPTANEIQVIQGFLADARARYKADPADAAKSLSIGESPRDKTLPLAEHAAWTLVCNLILNLDETLTQH